MNINFGKDVVVYNGMHFQRGKLFEIYVKQMFYNLSVIWVNFTFWGLVLFLPKALM